MIKTRIYTVWDVDEEPLAPRLVRAANQSQAIAHITRDRFHAAVANQEALVHLLGNDVEVEEARTEPNTTTKQETAA